MQFPYKTFIIKYYKNKEFGFLKIICFLASPDEKSYIKQLRQ